MTGAGAQAATRESFRKKLRANELDDKEIEIDVQETADGEVVVIHDSDLKKVGGVPLVVGQSTLQQLGYTDIGSWFDLSFSDQRIPTLREVLALCKDRIRVNIELKYYGHEKRLEQSVAELVRQHVEHAHPAADGAVAVATTDD